MLAEEEDVAPPTPLALARLVCHFFRDGRRTETAAAAAAGAVADATVRAARHVTPPIRRLAPGSSRCGPDTSFHNGKTTLTLEEVALYMGSSVCMFKCLCVLHDSGGG